MKLYAIYRPEDGHIVSVITTPKESTVIKNTPDEMVYKSFDVSALAYGMFKVDVTADPHVLVPLTGDEDDPESPTVDVSANASV